MFNAFGSSLWLMPFSKHCKADNIYWKHFFEGKGGCPHRQQCDEAEYISDYAGWPTDLVNIEVPSVRGSLQKSLSFLMWRLRISVPLSRRNVFPFPLFHHRYGGIPIHHGYNREHNIQYGVWKANCPVIFCQRSVRWYFVQNNRGLWPSEQGTCLSAWEVSLHFCTCLFPFTTLVNLQESLCLRRGANLVVPQKQGQHAQLVQREF